MKKTMAKVLRRTPCVALAAVLVCGWGLAGAPAAWAEEGVTPSQFAGTHTCYKPKDQVNADVLEWSKFSVLQAKSSKKRVAKIEMPAQKPWGYFAVQFKKLGTAKITYKVKSHGKRKSYVARWKVRKYTNPFKTLKIGSKSYKAQANSSRCEFWLDQDGSWVCQKARISASNIGGKKIAVKAKRGWRVVSIKAEKNGKKRTLKTGRTIPNDPYTVTVTLKNVRNGARLLYEIC